VRDAMLGMVVTITLSPNRSSSCGRSSPSCSKCATLCSTLAFEQASHERHHGIARSACNMHVTHKWGMHA